MAQEQLAGTYLFVGPQGVGKTALAIAFAQAAACVDPRSDPADACGLCESCRRIATDTNREVMRIGPAGDQTQIWQFWDRENKPRGALQHTITYAPDIGRKRVYIIERADTLNASAANSLLKVLEEPPPYVLFLLLAPHPARMLETILSRSQIIRLTPGPVEALAEHLCKTERLDPIKAREFAAYAEGRTGSALRLHRQPLAWQEIDRALDMAETIPVSSPLGALRIAEAIRKQAAAMKALSDDDSNGIVEGESGAKEKVGRKQLGIVLELLIAFYRDLLAISLNGPDTPIVHGDRRFKLAQLAANSGPSHWMACLDSLLTARRRVDQNAGIPLLTEWLAMNLIIHR